MAPSGNLLLEILLRDTPGVIDAYQKGGGDLVELVDYATDDPDDGPFAPEKLRGIYPDAVLAAVYNKRRNRAYAPEISRRLRELAGVCDAKGNVMPGYLMTDNGCINDDPDSNLQKQRKKQEPRG